MLNFKDMLEQGSFEANASLHNMYYINYARQIKAGWSIRLYPSRLN